MIYVRVDHFFIHIEDVSSCSSTADFNLSLSVPKVYTILLFFSTEDLL